MTRMTTDSSNRDDQKETFRPAGSHCTAATLQRSWLFSRSPASFAPVSRDSSLNRTQPVFHDIVSYTLEPILSLMFLNMSNLAIAS